MGSPVGQTAISVQAISYQYTQGKAALVNVSLAIEKGSQYGLIGPNGSGKSTLLKLLCTTLSPRVGRLSVLGRDVSRDEDFIRKNIGVVFQSGSVDKKLTVSENIVLMGRLQGLSAPEVAARRERLVSELEISRFLNDRVETLSGGTRRRVELAMALVHAPPILLLDEPTVGLDPLVRRDFWKHLYQIRKALGVTIVVATHFLDEAEFCDRLALFDRGRVVAEGRPAELTQGFENDVLTIRVRDPRRVAGTIRAITGVEGKVHGVEFLVEAKMARNWVGKLLEGLGEECESISVRRSGLESFFMEKVGVP